MAAVLHGILDQAGGAQTLVTVNAEKVKRLMLVALDLAYVLHRRELFDVCHILLLVLIEKAIVFANVEPILITYLLLKVLSLLVQSERHLVGGRDPLLIKDQVVLRVVRWRRRESTNLIVSLPHHTLTQSDFLLTLLDVDKDSIVVQGW